MIEPIVITAPIYEPVTVGQVQEHLRISHDDENLTIELYIKWARQLFEKLTGRTMQETEYEVADDYFPYCPHLYLPRAAPLLSVTSIKYTDSDGVETTWSPSSYVVDTHSMPGRVSPAYGQTWPSFTPYPLSAVRIRYKAGLSNSNSPIQYADPVFRKALMEMIGGAWENRESEAITSQAAVEQKMLTFGVRAVIENYKVSY